MAVVDALSMTSHAFAEAYASARGGRVGAIAAYSAFHREGRIAWPGGAPVAIERRIEEPNDEGVVIKFTQRVSGGGGGSAIAPHRATTHLDTMHREATHVAATPRATTHLDSTRLEIAHLETESVLIPMVGRKGRLTHTLCVSSQVGCAMGCTFCETAQMGLIRSLTVGEIVQQWWAATHILGRRPANIVFMGMGEPLDNLDAVISAIAILTDHHGPALPMSKITVSTVGRVDGLRRLAERVRRPGWHRLNLAVSLNAGDDATRASLMPINRRYPLAELQRALIEWPIYGGNKLCFEYVLIPGVNDRREDAANVAGFLRPFRGPPRRAMVNVIPYNPRRNSPWPAPNDEVVSRFLAWLIEEDVYCKRRRTKGRDMMGACGQLGNEQIRRRRLVPLSTGQGS